MAVPVAGEMPVHLQERLHAESGTSRCRHHDSDSHRRCESERSITHAG